MLYDNEIAFIEVYRFFQLYLQHGENVSSDLRDQALETLEKHRDIYEEFLHWKNHQSAKAGSLQNSSRQQKNFL